MVLSFQAHLDSPSEHFPRDFLVTFLYLFLYFLACGIRAAHSNLLAYIVLLKIFMNFTSPSQNKFK
jgi:hypothetical protein